VSIHLGLPDNWLYTIAMHTYWKHLDSGLSLIALDHATLPEQIWQSDITYIKTKEGNLYLSLITDAYSKRIMV
jgi:transposase InsO family protein